jgi:alpha-amylase
MAENGVMLQCFEWYYPTGGKLWDDIAAKAQNFADNGVTSMWLPPCSKGSHGGYDVGYAPYDLFDLGEFDQQGTLPTKYGTRQQLLNGIKAMHQAGLQVYADVVFNHKDGADATEDVWAQEVADYDRNKTLSDWYIIKARTRFSFPGRAGKYSTMNWFWWCFDAVCYDANHPDNKKLFRIKGRPFTTEVSHEHGNFDFLMADDLDMSEDNVKKELKYWGEWFLNTAAVDGFRIDACKHIRSSWFPEWLGHLRGLFQRELFSVGEYWSNDIGELQGYLAATSGAMSLFDVPLHYRFMSASRSGNQFDLRTIFDNTLTQQNPNRSVTFVENHDTQPCQMLESTVEPWFKPHAYALILLRREGYPCIFWADYFGSQYRDKGRDVTLYSHQFLIDKFLYARKTYGFGDQHDYFDHPNTIGWVRTGSAGHPGAMAVLLTNGSEGSKWMNVVRPNATFYDVTGHYGFKISANQDGWAEFKCPPGNVSVWLQE